ncbi:oxidoreductase [Streptobacillus canis]|uniref:oxidoreductase n=1 Tax=Streptobacillus canis TaxID=2678686 RepID=UPI0012E31E16|nr:NADPH dehydrogenase [Streptobacillus canis]
MKLLEKYILGKLELKNRVVMPPMDTYEAKDGFVNEFHIAHYGARAIGNVGLIIQEVTAVRSDGRISEQDLGIWSDEHIEGLKKLVDSVHRLGSKIGIQIGDAGRKGLVKGGDILSSSNIPFNDYFGIPRKMEKEDILSLINDFKLAARRAESAGYDYLELHAAHGYLINQFLSTFSNDRDDEYGGSFVNRAKLLGEILAEVRKEFKGLVSIRVSAYEWAEGGYSPSDLAKVLVNFKEYLDVIHVSSGGTVNEGNLSFYPGYQLSFAKVIKEIMGIPVIAVGQIDNFDLAEFAIRDLDIDLIAVGRGLLRNPNWIMDEAFKNNIKIDARKATSRAYFRDRFVEKDLKK